MSDTAQPTSARPAARRRAAQPQTPARADETPTSPALLALFFLSVSIPVPFSIGGTDLSANRLLMLALIIPLGIRWISGRAGRAVAADIFLLAFSLWVLVALVVNHGLTRIPFAAITAIETFGGFLVGRMLIRNRADYRLFFRMLLAVLAIYLPFTLVELFTDRVLLLDAFRAAFGSAFNNTDHAPRLGLHRVQNVFQHPILFGLFATLGIANSFYIWRSQPGRRFAGSGLALFSSFASLSAGALLAGVGQIGLILWSKITGNRWKTLAAIAAVSYVVIEAVSTRGPIVIMIEELTFSSATGWNRVLIWRHVTDDILANPIFGIGLSSWSRPAWLGSSVDNYWLVNAMRYGLVGFLFLALAIAANIRGVISIRSLPRDAADMRLGYLVGMVSVILSLATVHVWGPTGVYIMVYIGAGAWLYTNPPAAGDPPNDAPPNGDPPATERRGPQYTQRRLPQYRRWPVTPGTGRGTHTTGRRQ